MVSGKAGSTSKGGSLKTANQFFVTIGATAAPNSVAVPLPPTLSGTIPLHCYHEHSIEILPK